MSPQLTVFEEGNFKTVSKHLFSSQHPRLGLVQVLEKFGRTEKEKMATMKSLSILASEKMIELDIEEGLPYSASIQLLDQNGKEIPSEVCDTYLKSDSFGVWFTSWHYKTHPSPANCHEHAQENLDQSDPMVHKDCLKCFTEQAFNRCLAHNQSISFCKKCQDHSKKLRALICPEFDSEKMIALLMKEHKKDLKKRRGL